MEHAMKIYEVVMIAVYRGKEIEVVEEVWYYTTKDKYGCIPESKRAEDGKSQATERGYNIIKVVRSAFKEYR